MRVLALLSPLNHWMAPAIFVRGTLFCVSPSSCVLYLTISRWFGPIVPAAERMVMLNWQLGGPLKVKEYPLPALSGPLPGTGVTPSAAKTCALWISGVRSHMPPVAPSGSRSRRVTFHASLSPVFCALMTKSPHCPRFIVAGPVLSTVTFGAAIVIGGVTPHSPGRG